MKKIKIFLAQIISTMAFIGYFPFFPATFASLFSIPLIIFLKKINFLGQIFIFLATLLAGYVASTIFEKKLNKKDPKQIVIDEFVGMFIASLLIPADFKNMILIFLIFRMFDIIKPYPAKKIQKIKGGVGILADDIICGIYSNIIIRLLLFLF